MSKYFSESVGLASNEIIMEQLEERIVLDGEVTGWTQDADGVWHATDPDGLDYYWYSPDGNPDGVDDYYFRFDSTTGQWERDSDTIWHTDYLADDWVLFGDPDADSAFVYDGRWHNMGDGYWFAYNLGGQGYGYWWSMNDGNEYYCAYGYLTGGDWWFDTNGYYKANGWELLIDSDGSDDYVYDGLWHHMGSGYWFGFNIDGEAYGHWWYLNNDTEYYCAYGYLTGGDWWWDSNGFYAGGGWEMLNGAFDSDDFYYDGHWHEMTDIADDLWYRFDGGNAYWWYTYDGAVYEYYYDYSDGQWYQKDGPAHYEAYGDPGASSDPSFFVVGENQAPVNSLPGDQQVDEDTPLIFNNANGNLISVSDPDAGDENIQVHLMVSSGTLSLSQTTGLTFTFGADGTSSFGITGTTAEINGALDGLVFDPDAEFSGAVTLSMYVSDMGNTGSGGPLYDADMLAITVDPVNDAPEGTTIPDVVLDEDFGTYVYDVSGYFTDIDSSTLSYELGSIIYGDGLAFDTDPTIDSNGQITFDDLLNSNGYVDVQVRAYDGSDYSDYETFTLTVNPVNDAPVNTVPGLQTTDEDTPLVFSSANGNAISVADVDVGTGAMTMNLSVSNGTLTLAQTTGLSFTSGGDGTGQMTFEGSLVDINAGLAGMSFNPVLGYLGDAVILLETNDSGNTGIGGDLSDADSFTITVFPNPIVELVADINLGSGDSEPRQMIELNGILYFRADDGTNGHELWKYDPLTDTAEMVADIYSGAGDSWANPYTVLNGTLYFSANDGTHGTELWRYDPFTDVAEMVADINGSGGSTPMIMTVLDGILYFRADDGTHGIELWQYDPVSDVAEMVLDINMGASDSYPHSLTVYENALYFSANDGIHSHELWRYDPVADVAEIVLVQREMDRGLFFVDSRG